eukprot:jgi/Botrbrau1/9224/Bobra.0028s0020.1
MVGGVAQARLLEERKAWRKERPFGFFAKPEVTQDGSFNMLKWKCHIPGKKDTDWEGGFFPLTLDFPEDYPAKPPRCAYVRWRNSMKSCCKNISRAGYPFYTIQRVSSSWAV